MPKVSMDYSKCCIYKIEHINDESLVYVGHTTNFDKRKTQHKSSCNKETSKEYNYLLYTMMRDNGGWEMFKMIEVEKYNCKDKREAGRRENEVMKELKANMNTYRSYITEEEVLRRRREISKQYYENNTKEFSEKHKVYYEKHKEELIEYSKEYRNKNIDKVKLREKQYREKNPEKIKLKNERRRNNNKENVTCECGCKNTKPNLKRHQATKRHKDLMNKV